MLGSTFIFEQEESKLEELSADLDKLHQLIYTDLDKLMSLDINKFFSSKDINFEEREPIVYLPNDGLVIAKVTTEGLKYLIANRGEFGMEFSDDLNKLTIFIKNYGYEDIYELSTF